MCVKRIPSAKRRNAKQTKRNCLGNYFIRYQKKRPHWPRKQGG